MYARVVVTGALHIHFPFWGIPHDYFPDQKTISQNYILRCANEENFSFWLDIQGEHE
jgi:hypothetical protein